VEEHGVIITAIIVALAAVYALRFVTDADSLHAVEGILRCVWSVLRSILSSSIVLTSSTDLCTIWRVPGVIGTPSAEEL